jgi:superoxide reductase
MATAGEIYKCELCGNVVFVMEGGDGDLVCCGEEMKLLSGEDRMPFEGRLPKPGSP